MNAPTSMTMEYKSIREMAHGMDAAGKEGWAVVSQSNYTPKKGCMRMLLGGFIFFNRKPRFVVVYRRIAGAPPSIA